MPYKPDDPWLLPALKRIRKHPGTWLGSERVDAVGDFVSIYARARADLGVEPLVPAEADLLKEFGRWLCVRHNFVYQEGWMKYVYRIDSSERNAKTFFSEFALFLLERGIDLDGPAIGTWPPDYPTD